MLIELVSASDPKNQAVPSPLRKKKKLDGVELKKHLRVKLEQAQLQNDFAL